jgi:hypothetical protein
MIICQWHLDILYGKQAEAVRIMRAWGARKARQFRVSPGPQYPPACGIGGCVRVASDR